MHTHTMGTGNGGLNIYHQGSQWSDEAYNRQRCPSLMSDFNPLVAGS